MDDTGVDRILRDADEARRIEALRQLALLHRTPSLVEAWGRAEMARQFRQPSVDIADDEIPF